MPVLGLDAEKIKLNVPGLKTKRTLTGKHYVPHVEPQWVATSRQYELLRAVKQKRGHLWRTQGLYWPWAHRIHRVFQLTTTVNKERLEYEMRRRLKTHQMCLHSGRNRDDLLGKQTFIFMERALDILPSSFIANVMFSWANRHFEDALGYVKTIWVLGFYTQTMDLSYIWSKYIASWEDIRKSQVCEVIRVSCCLYDPHKTRRNEIHCQVRWWLGTFVCGAWGITKLRNRGRTLEAIMNHLTSWYAQWKLTALPFEFKA